MGLGSGARCACRRPRNLPRSSGTYHRTAGHTKQSDVVENSKGVGVSTLSPSKWWTKKLLKEQVLVEIERPVVQETSEEHQQKGRLRIGFETRVAKPTE